MNLSRNILLIPGPLTTSLKVKKALELDYSAREPIFIKTIKNVRDNLLSISDTNKNKYTSILLQGSGTYGNESIFNSLPNNSKVNVFSNGIYGDRLGELCKYNNVLHKNIQLNYKEQITEKIIEDSIKDCDSTHIALVHNETTSGIINPINKIIPIIKKYNKKVIVDAISSYGGIPININELDIDYLVGSSNKCLHGHPGITFIIANRDTLKECENNSNTLSLDLFKQYEDFELGEQFRFTPPVQIINSLNQSLIELNYEGIETRYNRYKLFNDIIYKELTKIEFEPYLPREICGPIVSTYYIPQYIKEFNFDTFSKRLRKKNIILYPSPINNPRLIRIGNIGDITMKELVESLNIIKSEILKFIY